MRMPRNHGRNHSPAPDDWQVRSLIGSQQAATRLGGERGVSKLNHCFVWIIAVKGQRVNEHVVHLQKEFIGL